MRFIPASLSCTIPYYFNQDCCYEDKTCLSAVFNFHDDKFWKSSGEHYLNKGISEGTYKNARKEAWACLNRHCYTSDAASDRKRGGVGKVCVRFLISYASASSVIPKPLIKINTNKIKTPRQACNNGPYPEKPTTK